VLRKPIKGTGWTVRDLAFSDIESAVVQVEFTTPNPQELNLAGAAETGGITVDEAIDIIKSALLTAYRHTDGHEPNARIEIDRKTGVGFGRIAATTARQVFQQGVRDAENEHKFGEFSTREGEVVGGVIQRD
ncbi:hypothetical protein ADUPG1_004701, partial [Aduncisulcus paluster]